MYEMQTSCSNLTCVQSRWTSIGLPLVCANECESVLLVGWLVGYLIGDGKIHFDHHERGGVVISFTTVGEHDTSFVLLCLFVARTKCHPSRSVCSSRRRIHKNTWYTHEHVPNATACWACSASVLDVSYLSLRLSSRDMCHGRTRYVQCPSPFRFLSRVQRRETKMHQRSLVSVARSLQSHFWKSTSQIVSEKCHRIEFRCFVRRDVIHG